MIPKTIEFAANTQGKTPKTRLTDQGQTKTPEDAGLARIMTVWPKLSKQIRRAILALVGDE
jgi:hypothetical protein